MCECARKKRNDCADVFPTCPDGKRRNHHEDQIACADGLPGKARRVHPSLHADAEETELRAAQGGSRSDRKSTRLNSSHQIISYAVFCLKKKKTTRYIVRWSHSATPAITTSPTP